MSERKTTVSIFCCELSMTGQEFCELLRILNQYAELAPEAQEAIETWRTRLDVAHHNGWWSPSLGRSDRFDDPEWLAAETERLERENEKLRKETTKSCARCAPGPCRNDGLCMWQSPTQTTDYERAQIKRMQDFLCERGLFQAYMDWVERPAVDAPQSPASGMQSPDRVSLTLTRRALSVLAALCDARALNIRKMIDRGELDVEDERIEAADTETYLMGLSLMLREKRDGG